MLPPQLRHGLTGVRRPVVTSTTYAALSHVNSVIRVPSAYPRTIWGWGRPRDWASHLDPMYHRFHRVRTIKTRAKLLERLRRRGKFNWDVEQHPFFTSKHIRMASHWDNKGRKPWRLDEQPEAKQSRKIELEKDENGREEDGYELSKREKEWKARMEAIRKRVHSDPYEAIFGKRFEPFWSPLVPSWMREEMGLQEWPKVKAKPQQDVNTYPTASPASTVNDEVAPKHKKTEVPRTEAQSIPIDVTQSNTSSRPGSYAYASSTSWDSISNKATKVEWDSVSNKTKRYEYDPISNRMVYVEAPKESVPVAPRNIGEVSNNASKTDNTPGIDAKFVNIPSTQSADARKAIQIPQSYLGSRPTTSVGPLKSTALSSNAPKPAALAKLPKDDLDLLTAENVRASMGKTSPIVASDKPTTKEEKAQMGSDYVSKTGAPDVEVDDILKHRQQGIATGRSIQKLVKTQWDLAETDALLGRELEILNNKKEKLLRHEHGLFHIERQKRELQKLDERIQQVTKQSEDLAASISGISTLQTSPQRREASTTSAPPSMSFLQSALERMQSKHLPPMSDPDDAAAHETTEPIDTSPSVPKQWSRQADMLQADRVRRTSDLRPAPLPRWIDDMYSRKHAFEARKAEEDAKRDALSAEETGRLQKANAMLEAEVNDVKLRMHAHENRYTHKLKDLRKELDIAYRQSSVHADKHVERIKELEADIAKMRLQDSEARVQQKMTQKIKSLREELDRAYRQSSIHADKHLERIKELETKLSRTKLEGQDAGLQQKMATMTQKIKSLREELDKAYRQSSIHSDKHLERIKWLESELDKAKSGYTYDQLPSESSAVTMNPPMQGEGELCANVTKYTDSSKWYKQSTASKIIQREAEKTQQKARDQALVRAVREVYENEYGVIDTNHRQVKRKEPGRAKSNNTQVVEVESNVDLGEELAKYEQQQPESVVDAQALAAAEKQAHDAQALLEPESSFKMKNIIASELAKRPHRKSNPDLVGKPMKQDEALAPKNTRVDDKVQWADPPVYKVLAYDSGNDRMSTATTTSNFSASEQPISVSQALSQLYQPARFVPHFAELQKDGYQVIFGTKDLLVFKQIKQAREQEQERTGGSSRVSTDTEGEKTATSRVNPIDGTTKLQDVFPRAINDLNGKSSTLMKPATTELANAEVQHDNNTASAIRPASAKHSSAEWQGAVEAANERSTAADIVNKYPFWQDYPHETLDHDIEYKHYPRVRREEEHFTGTKKINRAQRKEERHQRREERAQRREEQRRLDRERARVHGQRRHRRSALRYILGGGLVTAGVMYLVGSAVEKAREADERKRRGDEW